MHCWETKFTKELYIFQAAQTTNAWIITSGCNMGITKALGAAVMEAQSYNWDKHGMTHTLRCIGIAPWGYVERRKALVTQDGSVWAPPFYAPLNTML
jgi:hypothetical protein